MKPIGKEELYEHLSGFLKNKGIELKEGSYSKGIHAGCSLLADAINLSQRGLERAKGEIDKNLDRVRQVIHEKTAAKPNTPGSNSPPPVQESRGQTPKPASKSPADAKRPAPKASRRQRQGQHRKRNRR